MYVRNKKQGVVDKLTVKSVLFCKSRHKPVSFWVSQLEFVLSGVLLSMLIASNMFSGEHIGCVSVGVTSVVSGILVAESKRDGFHSRISSRNM